MSADTQLDSPRAMSNAVTIVEISDIVASNDRSVTVRLASGKEIPLPRKWHDRRGRLCELDFLLGRVLVPHWLYEKIRPHLEP